MPDPQIVESRRSGFFEVPHASADSAILVQGVNVPAMVVYRLLVAAVLRQIAVTHSAVARIDSASKTLHLGKHFIMPPAFCPYILKQAWNGSPGGRKDDELDVAG